MPGPLEMPEGSATGTGWSLMREGTHILSICIPVGISCYPHVAPISWNLFRAFEIGNSHVLTINPTPIICCANPTIKPRDLG